MKLKLQLPLSILIYHRVLAGPDRLFPEQVDARRVEQHMQLVHRWFRVMPLTEAVRRLAERSLPPRAACITFVDGYADSAEVALPILRRHGVNATFFVASGFLDGGCMWNDAVIEAVRNAPGDRIDLGRAGFGILDIGCPVRRRAVIDMLIAALKYLPPEERIERVKRMAQRFTPTMLSSDQLIALHRAGMEIGAHTISHPILASISNAAARAEIAGGRARLQDIIQAEVKMFAYPNGRPGHDFEERHAAMLRSQGFAGAVTTAWGAARAGSDPFYLPRFTPWDRGAGRFLLRMARNLLLPPA
ncbi:carbohydrate esterase family protein [Massilia eurypsychrophila]|uniref:Carbohydrate esterase family protein n=1 Tax=Massilia eurypsychrophila TaxID=1485217 RepID=A0A2G8TGA8_9BURK|nr:polysaccharide deacetylase family protein [Massilia eurypsychrophila]PIL45091.1 carbohydrate esterase family protein [Massilia eurypsychrophila]